jgi:LmeA-like phospholipid-binding
VIFAYLLAGLGFFFGLGSYGTTSFEHKAANDIKAELNGPNVKVNVQTRAVGLSAVSGHMKRVTISASNFSTPGLPLFTESNLPKSGKIDDLRIVLTNFELKNLHISRLESKIPDCYYDFGLALKKQQIRLSQSGIGEGFVTIEAKDLEQFILKKYHEIKTVHVVIERGKAHVWGYGEFIVVHTNFDVVASLQAVDGNKLVLANAAITFDGHPSDEMARNVLLQTLNPVVDLDKDLGLYGAISVTDIQLAGDEIRVKGQTRIPEDPALQKTSKSSGATTSPS